MAQTEQGEKDELYLPDNLENCQAELSAAQQELEEMKDKYLRAALRSRMYASGPNAIPWLGQKRSSAAFYASSSK